MQHTTDAYMIIPEISGVFVDAILTDEADNLVFGSFWGHDTAIRSFQGRLTLKDSADGLTSFNVIGDKNNQLQQTFIKINNIDSIKQLTGRVRTDVLGELVHCWLYRDDIIKPDQANHRMMLISQDNSFSCLWDAIKLVCPVPLLDHWEYQIKQTLIDTKMVTFLTGVNQTGIKIVIDEDKMKAIVKTGCLDGSLQVSGALR